MEKHKNSDAWTEAGYGVFAREGLNGIQVERLARILQLNKSGFYHYFGDLEGFCAELLNAHKKKTDQFVQELSDIKRLDPDCLHLVINNRVTIMFQVQLTRSQSNYLLYAASELVDKKIEIAMRELWCDYMEIPYHSDLALRYYAIVRDMFYTRISFQNFNYTFLHDQVAGAKAILDEIGERNRHKADHVQYSIIDDAV